MDTSEGIGHMNIRVHLHGVSCDFFAKYLNH